MSEEDTPLACASWFAAPEGSWRVGGTRGVDVLHGAEGAGQLYEHHIVTRTPAMVRGWMDAVLCGPAREWVHGGDPLADLEKMVAEDVARGRLPSGGRVVVETASQAREGQKVSLSGRAARNRFGHGAKREVPFSTFTTEIRRGSCGDGSESMYYLAASEIPQLQDEDGEEDAMGLPGSLWLATPMDSLYRRGGLAVSLPGELVGGLVTSSVNLWCGRSEQGSSSGLHHDFHDNVYVLIRGRKRFLLFPPGSAAHFSGLRGSRGRAPVQEFANGLCAYGLREKGEGVAGGPFREDGALVELAAKARMKRASEAYWALEDCEGVHSSALHAAAREVEASEDAYFALVACQSGSSSNLSDTSGESDDGEEQNQTGSKVKDKVVDSLADVDAPDNFCTCGSVQALVEDPSTSIIDVAQKIRVCEVRAGEMLYLPAGWYHEVLSFNDEGGEDGGDYHMALNYWLHPPCTGPQYTKARPYPDSFWADRLEILAKRLPALDKPSTSRSTNGPQIAVKRAREGE